MVAFPQALYRLILLSLEMNSAKLRTGSESRYDCTALQETDLHLSPLEQAQII